MGNDQGQPRIARGHDTVRAWMTFRYGGDIWKTANDTHVLSDVLMDGVQACLQMCKNSITHVWSCMSPNVA